MLRFEEQVKKVIQVLELESMPIGVSFSENPHAQSIERPMKICDALDTVSRENVVINLSKESCACRGGRHTAGWENLSLEEYTELLLTANVHDSRKTAETSVNRQPQPMYRGKYLIIGPLNKFETDPDIVLFFVNPAKAERILGLASYEGTEPFMHYPASSVCSTIKNTLSKGKPDVNLISTFERTRHKWPSDMLVIALPFKHFVVAERSIDYSAYGKRLQS